MEKYWVIRHSKLQRIPKKPTWNSKRKSQKEQERSIYEEPENFSRITERPKHQIKETEQTPNMVN